VGNQHADITNSLLAGRYRLGRVVGRGGMADVRSAYDELAGRTVAVKLFRTDLDQPESAARREAEGRIARELEHPGLVKVYETSFDGDRAFLVMELVLGSTLEELSAEGPLPLTQTADLGAQLADTLASVHAAGIVHRDVKPSNVLLASAGRGCWRTKLTDFGISRKLDATRLTSTGLLVGTARYLSPEQAAGEPAGFASDVYALGLVLLECVTGKKSYPGNIVETTVARLTRPPDIPATLGPLGELLTRMTARQPADRPAMAEVATRLRALADGDVTLTRPVAAARPFPAAAQPALAAQARRLPTLPVRRGLVAAAAAVALVLSGWGLLGGEPVDQATASDDDSAKVNDMKSLDPPADAPSAQADPPASLPGSGSGVQKPAGNRLDGPRHGSGGQGAGGPGGDAKDGRGTKDGSKNRGDRKDRGGEDRSDRKDRGGKKDRGSDDGPRSSKPINRTDKPNKPNGSGSDKPAKGGDRDDKGSNGKGGDNGKGAGKDKR